MTSSLRPTSTDADILACRAPNEWRSYRVWEPQGALHEHLCGISGPQSRAPPLPEYPHSTNPRTLTHVDGLNLDAPASPAPQESAPGCFSDCSWGDKPQLLNRAHDAAPGPPSLSSPQPNKSRLNTCHGFFHSAQRCLSRWGPAPTEAVASIGREAAQTGPGRACQYGCITQD